jgi:hypothetical protein
VSFLLIVRDNGVFIVAGGTAVVVVVVASSSCVIVPFNRLFTNWESFEKTSLIAFY